jgi:predicted  nucleic acid-binding Zn-ribbon protein
VERARADAEAASARDQLISLRRETENQRKEMGTVLARNMEFSQAIIDYQRKLRESSQKLQASEELGHRQSIEVAVLEKEKAMLASAEKRASEEVASLSERVHRLQVDILLIFRMYAKFGCFLCSVCKCETISEQCGYTHSIGGCSSLHPFCEQIL